MLANVVLIIIVGNLNQAQLAQWGWRVPLLIGAVTAFVVRTLSIEYQADHSQVVRGYCRNALPLLGLEWIVFLHSG